MKWTIAFLFLAGVLLRPASCHLSATEFSDFIEPMCFKNKDNGEVLLVNGQEVPLASTLENFISLVEKLEMANPTINLDEEVLFLLRNYTYEDYFFTGRGRISKWKPADTDYSEVKDLWEPDENRRTSVPNVEETFSVTEKCSLFFMLSHTVIEQAMQVSKGPERLYVNASWEYSQRSDVNVDDVFYPQELGVVAIRGTDQAVSLSRVLQGIYIGLKSVGQRTRGLDTFKRIPKNNHNGQQVDPLFALTLAEVLVIAQWPFEDGKRDLLGPNGNWLSSPSINTLQGTEGVCPVIYKLPEGTKSAYTYSSVRGAADGLILGQFVNELNNVRNSLKLSQLLRSYYSQRGVRAPGKDLSASFCDRRNLIKDLEGDLVQQMELFTLLVSTDFKDIEMTTKDAWDYYKDPVIRGNIYGDSLTNQRVCPQVLNEKDPRKIYPLETPVDVLVVLDSANSLEKQQIIVGHLANKIDLRIGGSSMTVYLDQRIGTSGLKLKTLVEETSSSACAACLVTQKITEFGASERDVVIQSIDEALQEMKNNETKLNGAKGKVVVYFNLADTDQTSYRLDRVLKQMFLTHQDVTFYAVGKENEIVKKYVRTDQHHVISSADAPEDVAQNLFDKLETDPAILQYTDCKDAKNEGAATFEEYVSPYTIQHWTIPAKYLLKSLKTKVTFEPEFGHIQVCYSRATSSPERETVNCKNTSATVKKLDFSDMNPCQSFSEVSCSPYYFSVMAVNGTDNNQYQYCKDTTTVKCKALDQVKFKVSHEGIRCSGCFGLMSSPFLMVLAFLILQLLSRKA